MTPAKVDKRRGPKLDPRKLALVRAWAERERRRNEERKERR